MNRFLLDTNMLLGFFLGAEWAKRAYEKYGLHKPDTATWTSIVCHGEILSLAGQRKWGPKKREQLETALRKSPKLSIDDPLILEAYAEIDAWTQSKKVDSQAVPPLKPAKKMGKNDLWIAATAHVTNATLLSTDKDFCPLDTIWFPFIYIDRK